MTTLPPLYVFSSPIFEDTYPIMGALGTALVGFNIFALVMILIPYRKGERWAWYTLWMLPLLWLSHFALGTDLYLSDACGAHHGRSRPALPEVLRRLGRLRSREVKPRETSSGETRVPGAG